MAKIILINPSVEVKDHRIRTAQEIAEKHIDGILNKDFKACSGKHCRSCDYGLICRWKRKLI